MEENMVYFLVSHALAFTGTLIRSGLKIILSSKEKAMRREVDEEFERQFKLYEEGLALRPSRIEIYKDYESKA